MLVTLPDLTIETLIPDLCYWCQNAPDCTLKREQVAAIAAAYETERQAQAPGLPQRDARALKAVMREASNVAKSPSVEELKILAIAAQPVLDQIWQAEYGKSARNAHAVLQAALKNYTDGLGVEQ